MNGIRISTNVKFEIVSVLLVIGLILMIVLSPPQKKNSGCWFEAVTAGQQENATNICWFEAITESNPIGIRIPVANMTMEFLHKQMGWCEVIGQICETDWQSSANCTWFGNMNTCECVFGR
jgi:hypothetical protein